MNVRDEIWKAEKSIYDAIILAVGELNTATGLYPTSIKMEIIENASYDKPDARLVSRVKITVGI